MKKLLKWLLGGAIFLVICLVALVAAKDFFARKFFVALIQQKTGYPASVEKLEIGILSSTLRIRGLKLNYPADKGGGILLDSPEIFVQYDREAAQRNEIHLKQLRWDIREIGVADVSSKGMSGLMEQASAILSGTNQPAGNGTDPVGQATQIPPGITFTGIDVLDFSVGTVRFHNPTNSQNNRDLALDVRNRKLTNVVSYMDLSPLAIELFIKGAFGGAQPSGSARFPKEPPL